MDATPDDAFRLKNAQASDADRANNVRQMMAVIPVHVWMTAVGHAPNASAPMPMSATVTADPLSAPPCRLDAPMENSLKSRAAATRERASLRMNVAAMSSVKLEM